LRRSRLSFCAKRSLSSNPISYSLRRGFQVCSIHIKFIHDILITFGCVDIAQHFLIKAGITALRRVRKSDNNRIALAVGATIVNRVEDLRESDIGTQCGLFNIEKIGDEYVVTYH
jgi:T-complex protein 1 subunit gamma